MIISTPRYYAGQTVTLSLLDWNQEPKNDLAGKYSVYHAQSGWLMRCRYSIGRGRLVWAVKMEDNALAHFTEDCFE